MRMVIKIAGALLEREEDVQTAGAPDHGTRASGPASFSSIHGGGRIFTTTLTRMGITSRFINGLRVTDRETRDAAVMVFRRPAQQEISRRDLARGLPGRWHQRDGCRVFSCGADADRGSREAAWDSSDISPRVNVDFLRSLWREGIIPVASCLGLGADGELYNINADHMAAAAAEFIRADRLDFLDRRGWSPGRRQSVERPAGDGDIEDLIRHNKVSGGMILKLEAAKRALAGGISEVRIVGGSKPRALLGRCKWQPRSREREFCQYSRPTARAAHGTAQ